MKLVKRNDRDGPNLTKITEVRQLFFSSQHYYTILLQSATSTRLPICVHLHHILKMWFLL